MQNTDHTFGILGYGYVGRATHLGLLKHKLAIIHDTLLGTSRSKLLEADTIFICLPTSSEKDLDVLIDEIKYLVENTQCQIILRSTVPVETCRQIENKIKTNIIYIPEFLRERYWEEDCQRRPLIVGKESAEIPYWLESEEKIVCSFEEAELIKMFSNSFATVRIAFANLFYDLSQKVDADYDTIKNSAFKVMNNQTYMNIPGHDGTRGFGGKCLPKDLDFTIDTLDKKNINNNWLKHIRELNKEWQKKF